MRTTLDIADDVLFAARALGKKERKSTGQVISELARRGLQPSLSPDSRRVPRIQPTSEARRDRHSRAYRAAEGRRRRLRALLDVNNRFTGSRFPSLNSQLPVALAQMEASSVRAEGLIQLASLTNMNGLKISQAACRMSVVSFD